MGIPYSRGTRVRLTSPYGYRKDPISGLANQFHGGVDLVGLGDKTIRCVTAGTVVASRMVTDKSNRTWEWGNYVCVQGDDGLYYYYCHLSQRIAQNWQSVAAGDVIGIEGSTGASTGDHLHFEVRDGTTAINPCGILGIKNAVGIYSCDDTKAKQGDNEYAWSDEAVEWATENGILLGDGNGNLMLDEPCTRRQMIVFLHRMYKMIGG